jgi:hypothetical protein
MTDTEDSKIECLDTGTIQTLWGDYRREHGHWSGGAFFNHLRTLVEDESQVDAVIACASCSDLLMEDDGENTRDGAVCSDCFDSYLPCNSCGDCVCEDEQVYTLYDTTVCDVCRDRHYSYCEECDGYYADDDTEHIHGNGCDCEAPRQNFYVRNDGDPPLENDTRATVTLPAGVISTEGVQTIARYLREKAYEHDDPKMRRDLYDLSWNLDALGDQWQRRDGNYTKRLSRHAYKTYGLKIAPEIMSHVGCIARDHSTAVDFEVEVTRNLNLSAEDFGHEESCWWGSYSDSRCTLKSNGGFGLRTFDAYGDVTGRAWVMPLRRGVRGFEPTLDTMTPDAFVVFNGYGDLSGYAATRIVAHMAGWTYRKIGFSCSPMYVNNDSGYLVTSEEVAKDYTDGHLSLGLDVHAVLTDTMTKELVHA